jgi:hypothetical protein
MVESTSKKESFFDRHITLFVFWTFPLLFVWVILAMVNFRGKGKEIAQNVVFTFCLLLMISVLILIIGSFATAP